MVPRPFVEGTQRVVSVPVGSHSSTLFLLHTATAKAWALPLMQEQTRLSALCRSFRVIVVHNF